MFHVEHYSIVKVNSDVFVENSSNCVLQSMWASFSPHDGVAIIAVVAFGKMLLIQCGISEWPLSKLSPYSSHTMIPLSSESG